MAISLTLASMAAIFGAMVVMALVPSVSVVTVSARAAAHGFGHGFAVTAGIVLGDILFIAIVIGGLKAFAEALGNLFVLIQYAGSAYLMWLGIKLWRARAAVSGEAAGPHASLGESFFAGLFITLADQKAIFFYFGFFPAFVDIAGMSVADALLLIIIAAVAVGGVKLGYAYTASQSPNLSAFRGRSVVINTTAACIMFTVGILLAIKAIHGI